ncbi:hypothetical protein HD554DRAFT_2173575 [Boletus coccyginus]|nr:hypothetical protein HD554DRAFT_2173575 [Boletus coccyginus]
MHHALYIEEILLNVFSYCYNSRLRQRRRQRHLAALARTCKTFKGPALDMIWAELDDLTPLVRCLPEESWVESEGVYSLRKRLEQTDWDIILGYAHRVRAFPQLCGSLGLAGDCIEALSNPPSSTESIFPYLRIVRLREPSVTIAPLIRHLANPKLTDILFGDTENLGAAIHTFGERCPIVTDFWQVSQWAHADTISDLICCWQNLRYVMCYRTSLNVGALSHLSRLHNLLQTSFRVHDAVVDRLHATLSPNSTLTFSALYFLYLTSDYLIHIWRLFHHLRIPAVRILSVGLHARPTAPDLMSFFVALQEACTHTSLVNIFLQVLDDNNEPNGIPLENGSLYYITFDHLRPLTIFVNITSIVLTIPCGVDLSEYELLHLASSWPHLATFEVGKDYDWTASSTITPGGFLQLLERCRSLRVFSFMFDCRGYTEIPQGHPWRGLTMPKRSFIHLLHSPIEEESIQALGVFFHVAPYPEFDLTTHWNNRRFRGSNRPQGLCDLHHDRWERARSLARDLWEERRDLRRSLETRPGPL